ncbi:MAG: (2Fe-2S)-binding protein [Synergistetes bacterium]|nr:(2Fe-2S)-binding protein [Synergistota bacterium]
MEKFTDDDVIVCRCEDVTLGQIREVIRRGYTDPEEIKRITRAGMGPCQGKTCRDIIIREVARITGKRIDEIPVPTYRPPSKPIKVGLLAEESD